MNKTLAARIQHKRDTSSNFTAANPILLNGEIIVVDTESGEVRTKTGDGIKRYVELPFDDERMKSLVNSKTGRVCSASQPENQPVNDYWDEIIETKE